jgi:hypothetical protein
MGCICGCHDKLDAIGVRGCCFECEKDHDPLRNALLQVSVIRNYVNEEGVSDTAKVIRVQGVMNKPVCEHDWRDLEPVVHDGEQCKKCFEVRTKPKKQVDLQQSCDHKWSHIEDHHVYCPKCKKTADLCFTCETEKQNVGGILVCLNCRGH